MSKYLPRRFCFTLNNYTDDDITKLLQNTYVHYICFGKEIAPTTGTPHLQGYIEVKQTTFKNWKSQFPTMHIEKARGSLEANKTYCSKDGSFTEHGTPRQQGKRTDIELAREHSSLTMREFLDTQPVNFQTIKVFEKYLSYHEESRHWPTTVVWLQGPSGSGKTRWASQFCKTCTYWKDSTKWWDGYDKHPIVIFDDFRSKWFDFSTFLRILDRYPYRCEVKGGYRQLLCKSIIITSINDISQTFQWLAASEPIDQVRRRVSFIGPPNSDNLISFADVISRDCNCDVGA